MPSYTAARPVLKIIFSYIVRVLISLVNALFLLVPSLPWNMSEQTYSKLGTPNECRHIQTDIFKAKDGG